MGDVLYVGADDSNHAGDSRGEIILTTFSWIHEDSLVRGFKNRGNYREASQWLKCDGRDYRFTVCTSEEFRYSNQNLSIVAPYLIEDFLKTNKREFDKLCIYLDGRLSGVNKRELRESLADLCNSGNIVVDNFIKKQRVGGKIRRGYHCPKSVWVADILANNLCREGGSVEEMRTHEKMVDLGF